MAKRADTSKPIYKRVWFWILIVIVSIIFIARASSDVANAVSTTASYQKNNQVEVTVADFSTMTKEEIKNWFTTNKINGRINDEYSDSIAKGSFIRQSVEANSVIHEGDKVEVAYSLGKEPTTEEKNALKNAESYSRNMHMSKQGIYKQLTSTIEGFTKEAAQYAIDNIEADWNENALEKAKSYQRNMSMSKQRIYNQLISSVEGFTKSEAQYAIDNLED